MVVQDTSLRCVAGMNPLPAGDVNAVNTMCGQPGKKLAWVKPKVDRVCVQVMKIK
jgi:hypothetical protein